MSDELTFEDENLDLIKRKPVAPKGHFFRNLLMRYSGGLFKTEKAADTMLTIIAILFFILAFRSFIAMTTPPVVEIVPSPVGDNPVRSF
jgi:hypothetical protein